MINRNRLNTDFHLNQKIQMNLVNFHDRVTVMPFPEIFYTVLPN